MPRSSLEDPLAIMRNHARQLERELAHWQRMYECAQNANALRAKVLERGLEAEREMAKTRKPE